MVDCMLGSCARELGVSLHRLGGDVADVVGSPVPLMALGVEGIERAVPCRIRQLHHAVEGDAAERTSRREQCIDLLRRSGVAPHDAAHLLEVEVLGEGRCREGR